MAANVPFTRAQHATMKIYQDGKPVSMLTKNFELRENATEVADPVNGELRDRLDKVTNYYEASCDIYMSDLKVIQSQMDAQDLDDAAGIPPVQTAAFKLKHRDGTISCLLLQECKFGPFGFQVQDRTGALMVNLKVRGRFVKEVQAI